MENNNIDNIQVGDYTLKEWREMDSPSTSLSFDDAESFGLLTPEEPQQEGDNKFTNVLDTAGIEHPNPNKQYEKLGTWDTTVDVGKSVFTEASHFLAPKDKELQYESRTHFGENMKYMYRYIAGTAGFMLVGDALASIKGFGLFGKILSGAGKALSTNKLIKTGEKANKLAKVGAAITNASLGGALSGALADFNLYRPEENEGHLADVFGNTNNALISYLQSKDTDTDINAKLKNVVEGLVMGAGIGNIVEFGLKPLFKTSLKNLKALKEGKEGAVEAVLQDQIKLERFTTKADLLDAVENLKAEAEANGQEASQLLIDRLHPNDNPEAQQMLKVLDDGEEVFIHPDGTWDISVNKWDDAYKVSPEEFKKQLTTRDIATESFEGDSALSFQDQAVKDTWINRGWIGAEEDLNKSNANKIVKNYKDKWQLDNNIKVEFVDGLKINGKAVEGNTQSTKYLGKNEKPTKAAQTKIDKKKQEIRRLQDKITTLEDKDAPVNDELNLLKEDLRIKINELKDLEKLPKPKKINDITIKIDTNAKNPYATLRAELEHARDIAKKEIPNQKERHFSRYNGLNEGEIAPDYVYKKAQGKASIVNLNNEIETIKENVQHYETEGFKFEETQPDGFGESKYNLKNSEGKELGYVEYTADDNSVSIDYIRNTTRGTEDVTPDVAEKLVDKVISEHPNQQIHWDAISDEGINFKNKYLRKHPELQNKIEGINDTSLAQKDEITYNTSKGGINEGSNHRNREELGDRRQENISNDKSKIQTDKSERPNNGNDRSISASNNTTDARGKNTSISPTQLKIDFSQNLDTKQSTGDIVTGIVNGEIKPQTKADIETIVSKVEQLNPEISGFNWEDLIQDSEAFTKKLEEIFNEDDVSRLLEIFAKGDSNSLEHIVRKEMAAVDILNKVAEAGKKMGDNASIEAKEAIIDTIRHTSDYIIDVKSGFGRGLNSQKPINSLLESYGAERLSSWTKEGIRTFSEALIDEVNNIISLNFTRGNRITPQTLRESLVERLLRREDTRDFVQFLLQNDEMKAAYGKEVEKLLKNPQTANVDSMAKALTTLINTAEYNTMFKASQLAPTKKGFFKTIADWSDKNGGFTSYYVHNLLSGLGSLAKNIGSGAINTVYFPARKILAGFDPFIDEATRQSLGNEGWRTYKCMLQSWEESWQLMKEAFLTGNGKLTDIGENTLNITDGKFKGYHEFQNIDYYFQDPSKFWEGLQNLHSIMTRAMGATDEFMSQLNYRAISRSKALQEAERYAADAGMSGNEQWINEEADRIFKDKFDKYGQPVDVESLNEARTILYQNNLDGTMYDYKRGSKEQMRTPTFVMNLAGSLQNMANNNVFMKCMFPFVKTGANILQMALDHNPIYMLASPVQQKLLLAQTAEGALARSQCAFGMFSLGIGTMMAFNGMITGSAPSDPKERKALFATGWKPYSFKVGDNYISYQGYEPLHGMLGFAADCANMYSTIANPEDEARLQHFQAQILPTLINNFLDKAAFRTGLSQLDVVLNPQNSDEWGRAMAQTVKGLLPDVAFVTNTGSVGEHDVMQPKTFYERVFYRYFPNLWQPKDYRRNVFGEKQSITGLITTSMSEQNNTPEEQALEHLAKYGYTPTEIDDVIANTGLKISDFKDSNTGQSAIDAMKEEMSTVTIQGMTLREAIRTLVTSDEYQILPDGVDLDTGARWGSSADTKINAINDIFLMYKQRAKKNIIENSENFVDSQGRTIQDASEEVQLNRLQQLNDLY